MTYAIYFLQQTNRIFKVTVDAENFFNATALADIMFKSDDRLREICRINRVMTPDETKKHVEWQKPENHEHEPSDIACAVKHKHGACTKCKICGAWY